MAVAALSWLAGTIVLLWLPAFPDAVVLGAIGLTGLASGALGWHLARAGAPDLVRSMVGAAAVAAAGFLYAAWQAHDYLQHRWPEALTGERVFATAVVEGVPAVDAYGWSFDAVIEIEAPLPRRTLRVRAISREPAVRPRAGERWRLVLTLRPPRGRLNPGSIDAERIFFYHRLHASGVVVISRLNRKLDGGHRFIDSLRERIVRRIDEHVTDRDAAALIGALAVGATREMTREQWRVFNATGTTHLVAISGLHVTLFAFAMLAFGRRLWRIALYRWVPWPRESFAAVLGIVAATGYALLAGFSVPTQRSLIMFGAWLLARVFARACNPVTPLSLALVAVLLLDPFAPLSAGFWLSFAAMVAIVIVVGARFSRRSMLHEATSVQIGVSLILAPLTLAWFGGASIIGLLVNAIAIPVVSWVLVPTILLSVAFMPWLTIVSGALLHLAAWIHDIGWPWLVAAADSEIALVRASPPPWWYACALIGVGVALMPWPLRLRIAATLWLIPLVTVSAPAPPHGGLELTVLDVGRGTSIVVRTRGHVLVYDVGDAYGDDGRAVESTIVPFLRDRKIAAVDELVIGRLTERGSPGMTALLAALPVRRMIIGGGVGTLGVPGARSCNGADVWHWEGVDFRIFTPDIRSREGLEATAGCVLLIESSGTRILLAGDVDAAAERWLAAHLSQDADIAMVPRGGSDTASTTKFIRAVAPRWAIVSGSRSRRSGGDKPAIVRWQAGGAHVLATADTGAIRFAVSEKGLGPPMLMRAADRRLWRAPPEEAAPNP